MRLTSKKNYLRGSCEMCCRPVLNFSCSDGPEKLCVAYMAGAGAQFCRSAGTSAQLLERDETRGLALLRMQSKEQRYVQLSCMATVGEVSNPEHKNQTLGKAGRSRWMGRRPQVRGVAMNPVDHPNGGGEGKKSGKGLSPWGMHSKGFKTVRKHRPFIKLQRWKAKKSSN